MQGSSNHSAGLSSRWLLPRAAALLGAVALGAGLNTPASMAGSLSTAAVPIARSISRAALTQGQDTSTMSPDQLFLRQSLQSIVGGTLIVHNTLHLPGTFPSKADAQKIDQRLDDQSDRIRTALKTIYNDSYAPEPRATARSLADSLSKLTGPHYDQTFRKWFIEYDRLTILSIDRAMPKMTNATVKALAQKMRASANAEMTTLQAEVNAPIPT